ncbi:DDE Tnp 1 7 domain containing protein, partial [Asbolus verrucosus]
MYWSKDEDKENIFLLTKKWCRILDVIRVKSLYVENLSDSAKRYNRKEHKEVLLPQPRVIYDYNKYMGGVDLHDNGVANYRIAIREQSDALSCEAMTNPSHGRPSKSALTEDIKFDNIGHLIIRETNSARKKCRLCKSNTIYLCKTCKVHQHPDCFERFHIKN